MSKTNSTVFIVDDDDAVRHLLSVICQMNDIPAETYESAEAFQRSFNPDRPGCLVTDQRMPGLSGLELLDWMSNQPVGLPVIMITGHGDLPVAVTAFRGGALDFLEKPFDDSYFLERVRVAMTKDTENRKTLQNHNDAMSRYRRLSRRERAVMELMVRGLANKLIAAELDIGIRTVESHRANVLKKMGTTSLSELTRMHLSLDLKSQDLRSGQ